MREALADRPSRLPTPHASSTSDMDPRLLRAAGYWLHLIRAIEEGGRNLYLQGKLPGSFYDGRGQEATAVGAALAMQQDDVACPLIRDMAVHLVRGVSPSELFRHYLGKAGGPMEGRDGNIHLGAFDRGTIPMISHLPEMLPVGMGVALSRSWRGMPSAALCFCGDGASAGGVFHETLNLAAVWKAPLVVVLERNRYAYMTPEAAYLPVDSLRDRGTGYGIQSATADGNNVADVYEVVRNALEHARDGHGPILVEVFTYRMHGHGAHDAQKYVPPEELEEWAQLDPLRRWRMLAEEHAAWTETDQVELEERITREVRQALTDALEAPYPPVEELGPSVFAP
jgi:TPP-dependent pyruvate/acetoin dehydrogenase alpha subunit